MRDGNFGSLPLKARLTAHTDTEKQVSCPKSTKQVSLNISRYWTVSLILFSVSKHE